MNTLLLFLAALSLHRIWNYEDIAAPLRAQFTWKLIACKVCNPFWIALIVAAAGCGLGLIDWRISLVFPFAAYLPIRATVWAYDRLDEGVPVAAAPAKPGCSSCGQKQADLAAVREKAIAYGERVVIFSARSSLDPHVAMLANFLARDKGRQVQIWISAATTPADLASATKILPQIGSNVVLRAIVPFSHDPKQDQIADDKTVAQLSGEIGLQLMNLGNAKVLTIDALYDPHLLPLAQALQQFSQTKAFAWVHFASGTHGWTRPADPAVAAARATIPAHHHLAVLPSMLPSAIKFYQLLPGEDAARIHPVVDPIGLVAAVAEAKPIA